MDPSRLKSRRVTHCISTQPPHKIQECEDEWRCSRPYYNPLEPDLPGATWTGWTEFEITEEQAELLQEEPRGGAKRRPEEAEAEEDKAVTARADNESGKPGVKRKAKRKETRKGGGERRK